MMKSELFLKNLWKGKFDLLLHGSLWVLLLSTVLPKKGFLAVISEDARGYVSHVGTQGLHGVKGMVLIFMVAFFGWRVYRKVSLKEAYGKPLVRFISCMLVVLLVGSLYWAAKMYHGVYLIHEDYEFTLAEPFQEPKYYQVEDVVKVTMKDAHTIYVTMADEKKVYVSYGVMSALGIEENGVLGSFHEELIRRLDQEHVPMEVLLLEDIEKEMRTYQSRSDSAFWHRYLPEILLLFEKNS